MILFSIGEVSNPYPEDQFWLAIWANNRDAAVEKFDQEWQREGNDPLTPDEKSKLRIEDCSPKGFYRRGWAFKSRNQFNGFAQDRLGF